MNGQGGTGAKRPRRLVFVWEHVGPTHGDRLRALARADPARAVIAIQYTPRSHTYGWAGGAVDGFALWTLFPDGRATPARLAARLLRACLRAGRADVFLCHYEEWPILLVACILRLLGRRVFTMMDSKFDDYPRRLWREVGKALFLRPYTGALTASARSRDYLRFLGVPVARMALGYAALEVGRIAALAGMPPAPDGTPFAQRDFVVVARLVPKKNIPLALAAYALWRAETGGGRDLHLCGSGPLEPALRAQAAALGIAANVHFHGFVQSAAVAGLLARALCLILPSVEEQFGLAVIEALALGVPVLVSGNAGACDELVRPGRNGFILHPGDAAGCAALMALLSEDEPRWRRFATAAFADRNRADAPRFAEAVLALANG